MDAHTSRLPSPAAQALGVALAAVAAAALGCAGFGAPLPQFSDEFTYLFAAQTFAAGHLAYPPPPFPDAFHAASILVEPMFASKYPPGQGLFLALGYQFGHPIAGVWLSAALAAVALWWFARGLWPVSRAPLAVATLFIAAQVVHSTWVSSYWGGHVAFAGAAFVFGYAVRLRAGLPGPRAALALGGGLALLALSRPFEGLLVVLLLALLQARTAWSALAAAGPSAWWRLAPALPLLVLAAGFQLALNLAVTGHALHMPYAEYERQYLSDHPVFAWEQPVPAPKANAVDARVLRDFPVPATPSGRVLATYGNMVRAVLEVTGPFLAALALVGIPLMWRLDARLLVLALLLPLPMSASRFTVYAYYFAPLAPLWFVAGASGLVALRERGWRLAFTIAITGVLVLTLGARVLDGRVALRSSPRETVLAALGPHAPAIGFVRYADDLSPHLVVVYNHPRLDDAVLLVNETDPATNCAVARHYADRRPYFVLIRPQGMEISPIDLAQACGD